jgi:hypothetical protein
MPPPPASYHRTMTFKTFGWLLVLLLAWLAGFVATAVALIAGAAWALGCWLACGACSCWP